MRSSMYSYLILKSVHTKSLRSRQCQRLHRSLTLLFNHGGVNANKSRAILCIRISVTIAMIHISLINATCEWDLNSYVGLDPRFAGVSLLRTIDVPLALITVVPDPATRRANNVFSTTCMTKNTSATCSTAWKQKEWESIVLFHVGMTSIIALWFRPSLFKISEIFLWSLPLFYINSIFY